MKIDILNGIIDAIQAESRTPSPSHQNLARLTAMALKELAELIEPKEACVSIHDAIPPQSETLGAQASETVVVDQSKHETKKKLKKTK